MAQTTTRSSLGQFAQGRLHVFRLFESTYTLIAVDGQDATQQLQWAERANNDISTARDLLRQLEAGISIESKWSMERIISTAEYWLRILAQSLRPARCEIGLDSPAALHSRSLWILGSDDQEVAIALRNLRAPCDCLIALVVALQSIQVMSNAGPVAQPFNNPVIAESSTPATTRPCQLEDRDNLSISDPAQLLHYRRILRNKHRSTSSMSVLDNGTSSHAARIDGIMESPPPVRTILEAYEMPGGAPPAPQTPSRLHTWNPSLPPTAELEGCMPEASSGDENGRDFFTLFKTPAGGSLGYQSSSMARGQRSSTPQSIRSCELPLDIPSDIKALSLSPSSSSARSTSNILQRRHPSNASACARRPVGAPPRLTPSSSSASRGSDGQRGVPTHPPHTPTSRRNSSYSDIFQPLDPGRSSTDILDLHKTLSTPSLQSLEEQPQPNSTKGVQSTSLSSSSSLGAYLHHAISSVAEHHPVPYESIAESTPPHISSQHTTSSPRTTSSPHISSPHISSPHISSPHISSPHISSPHISSPQTTSSPHISSPHISSPHISSPQTTSSTPSAQPTTHPPIKSQPQSPPLPHSPPPPPPLAPDPHLSNFESTLPASTQRQQPYPNTYSPPRVTGVAENSSSSTLTLVGPRSARKRSSWLYRQAERAARQPFSPEMQIQM